MRAVGINDVSLIILAPVQDKFFAQVLHCFYLTYRQILGVNHPEPTKRKGKRDSLVHKKTASHPGDYMRSNIEKQRFDMAKV
jgi:hypothetical protein